MTVKEEKLALICMNCFYSAIVNLLASLKVSVVSLCVLTYSFMKKTVCTHGGFGVIYVGVLFIVKET